MDRLLGYAIALIVAAIAMMFLGILSAQRANAGTVCRIKQQAIVQQVVAQPVYYAIGQSLRQEATATYGFRQSDEYIELQQLRGYKAGVEAVTISVAGSSSPLQDAPGHPAQPEGGPTTPPPAPSSAPQQPAAPAKSVLQQTCAKCHSGENPKGDIWLDGSVSLQGPDAAVKRDAIVAAIRTGHMPPSLKDGERLPLETREAIEDEIHGVEVVAE